VAPEALVWEGAALPFGVGAQRADAPVDDALWRTYYANSFNPAQLNAHMRRREMPQKYRQNLPEAGLLPGLIRDAGQRGRAIADAVRGG
jgi:uracil-DNA glycosylase